MSVIIPAERDYLRFRNKRPFSVVEKLQSPPFYVVTAPCMERTFRTSNASEAFEVCEMLNEAAAFKWPWHEKETGS